MSQKPKKSDVMAEKFKKKRKYTKRQQKTSFRGELTNPVGYPNLEPILSESDLPKACEQLIEHMASGKSFESFASQLNVSSRTLYNYIERYPELMQAKEVGKSKSLEFWEELGIKGIVGTFKNFNATTYIFSMKNKHNWVDKKEIEQTNNHILSIRGITDKDYVKALKQDKFLVAEYEDIDLNDCNDSDNDDETVELKAEGE